MKIWTPTFKPCQFVGTQTERLKFALRLGGSTEARRKFLLKRADVHLDADRPSDAIKVLNEAIKLNNNTPSYLELSELARAYIKLPHNQQAIFHLTQAIDAEPQDASLYRSLANCYIKEGNLSTAINTLENMFDRIHPEEICLEDHSKLASLYRSFANCYIKEGNLSTAINALENMFDRIHPEEICLEDHSKLASLCRTFADKLAGNEDFNGGIKVLENIFKRVKSDQICLEDYSQIAYYQLKASNYQEAIKYAEKGLDYCNKNNELDIETKIKETYSLYLTLAEVKDNCGDTESAKKILQKGIDQISSLKDTTDSPALVEEYLRKFRILIGKLIPPNYEKE